MTGTVVFYQLSRKFVNPRQDVPAASKQLIHYTLAIGHHIGIIDCFTSKLEVPRARYADWIAHLLEGEARRKLEGLLRFGEIEIGLMRSQLSLQMTIVNAKQRCAGFDALTQLFIGDAHLQNHARHGRTQ